MLKNKWTCSVLTNNHVKENYKYFDINWNHTEPNQDKRKAIYTLHDKNSLHDEVFDEYINQLNYTREEKLAFYV